MSAKEKPEKKHVAEVSKDAESLDLGTDAQVLKGAESADPGTNAQVTGLGIRKKNIINSILRKAHQK